MPSRSLASQVLSEQKGFFVNQSLDFLMFSSSHSGNSDFLFEILVQKSQKLSVLSLIEILSLSFSTLGIILILKDEILSLYLLAILDNKIVYEISV